MLAQDRYQEMFQYVMTYEIANAMVRPSVNDKTRLFIDLPYLLKIDAMFFNYNSNSRQGITRHSARSY